MDEFIVRGEKSYSKYFLKGQRENYYLMQINEKKLISVNQ